MAPKLDALLSGPLSAIGAQAIKLTDAGLDGMHTYEGQTDPFLPIAVAADKTEALLYTNIAVALPRSPMHLAMQAWDLQRLTNGRFALGLGTQIKAHIERRYGGVWDRPRAQMAEIIAAIRAIFDTWQNGTPLEFEGTWTTHTLMPPTLSPPPLDCGPPPIWLAALGPRMTALAGQAADGLLVHPFTSRRHLLEGNLPNLEVALSAAGRPRSDVTLTVGAIIGLWETPTERDQALAVVRGTLGFYGSTPAYRPVLEVHGWGDLQPRLRTLTRQGRWAELGELFDDEQVATLAVVGTPDEVAAALHPRFDDVAERIAMSTPALSRPDLLRDMVEAYRAS